MLLPSAMKFTLVLAAFVLVCSFISTEAIFSGGIGLTTGGLLAAAIGLKALGGFGLLLASSKGRRRGGRYGRSAAENDLPALLNEAAVGDETDCAKKFVCETHAKALASLDETERSIYLLFGGSNDAIDVSSPTVQFDLAALVGRRAGFVQCQKVYARCDMDAKQMKAAMTRA